MLRVFVLASLLAAAAAQSTFYCGIISAVTDRDFHFVTRRSPNEVGYPPGLICELSNNKPGTGIMLDIESFSVRTAVLTVTEGSKILFRGSSLPKYKSSIVALSGNMRIRFNSTGDYSGSSGIRMRIRLFAYNRCPLGWTYLYDSCFGTSNATGDLNYVDAQKACNSMSANLLQIPSQYSGSFSTFMRMLPAHLRQNFTFIGLTDRAYRFDLYWLNGDRQSNTSEVSCVSSGSYSTCIPYERCATFSHKSFSYAIYMDSCTSTRDYACSMPPGATGIFYTVPNYDVVYPTVPPVYPTVIPRVYPQLYPVNYGIIWGAVIGSFFVLSLIIGGIYTAVRSKHVRRSTSATGAAVSTARVSVAPPNMRYHVHQNFQPPNPPMNFSTQGPFDPSEPPPTYNEVVSGAYNNGGYDK